MKGKSEFFLPAPNKPLVYIMLSGLPCTGKSTLRAKMLSIFNKSKIPCTVISGDDIAYKMCNEFNNKLNKVTYTDICNSHRIALEERYQKAVVDSTKERGVVILDRTYLTLNRRKGTLDLIKNNPVHIVSLTISNRLDWQARLEKRNSIEADKMISQDIIAFLEKDMAPPTKEEGFASVLTCSAVGEPGWEKEFDEIIVELRKLISFATDKEQPLLCTTKSQL